MNPFAFAVFVFAISSIPIGLQVLVRRKDLAAALYFLLSSLYFAWGVGYALCISGNLGYRDSLVCIRVSNVAAAFIPMVWLHFCLVYTGRMNIKNWFYLILYLIPCAVSCFAFSDHFISGLRSIVGLKYYPIPGFIYGIHTSIYFVTTPVCFYQLWRAIEKLSGEERRRQINFLIVSFVGYLGGGLSFFPVYDVAIPQYGLFLLPLYPFGKAYFMGSSGLLFDEERLAQAAHKDKLAAMGILTASMNHEIRSPLFVMRALVETEAKDPALVEKLMKQIDRITGVTSRLTHFAKKGVDEEAKIETIDLKEVLADIRPLFQHQLNYQNIEYVQDIPNDLPKLKADRRYLEEILFNLILNACQALRNVSNPKIQLKANVSGSSASAIEISIADNGPGIPSEQLKNIFKPFHTSKQEGTGLGLYITKQLVEKCGGMIALSSINNAVTEFRVTFTY